ncbi:MAG TPA: TonB-dependent receptor [Crocinitomix sp.]|nr:TonB-dependent receptor [Crocinitomix sp.]
MKKYLQIAIFIFAMYGYAQNHTLKGQLTNTNNESVSFSNISLLSKDSIFIKGTSSDKNGNYIFENLDKEEYKILISNIEYEKYQSSIHVKDKIHVFNIILKNNTNNIDEVVINAKKPFISQKADRLVFNVQKTYLSEKNTWEIIQNTPSVFINQDNIIVKGSSSDIYINDKKIQLSGAELKNYLASIDGNTVKSIEVINNPSAKYEANSSSILNIILTKKTSLGYKGSVITSYEQGFYSRFSFGTSHFYTTKKVNLFANYNFSPKKEKVTMDEYIHFYDINNEIDSKTLSFYNIVNKTNTHNVIFNLDYKLSPKSKLSLSTSHFFEPNKDTENITDGIFLNNTDDLTGKYNALSLSKNENKNFSYALGFTKNLKKEGETISIGVTYDFFNNTDNQQINTNYYTNLNSFINNNVFKVNSNQNIKIYSSQIDYTLPLKKAVVLELGAKSSKIETESGNAQFNYNGTDFIKDISKTDEYTYKETNYAAYASANKTWKKWYLQFGLRAEKTYLTGNSKSLNKITDTNYFKIFPTSYLSYFPSDKHDFSLSYGKHIERPKFRQLNPFQSYFSDFAVNVGNPYLKPAISHKLDFAYLYNSKHRFNIFYTSINDKIEDLSYQDNSSNIIKFVFANLKDTFQTGFDYSSYMSITKKWTFIPNFTIYYKENSFNLIDNQQEIETQKIWRSVFQLRNNFSLLKDNSLNISVLSVYASPIVRGSYTQSERKFIDIDFSKKIFKNKATVTLLFKDILNTDNLDFNTKYRNQQNGFFQKNETRYIKLGFTYNFGNNKLRENNATKTSSEKDRIE